jgi:hypothetical protein
MTFTLGIPAANNNPSNDQPLMEANFTQTYNVLNIDHVTFNNAGQGQHKQVTFNDENVPSGPPTDPTSILYTDEGEASTLAELYYQNQNAVLPISAIRALGVFSDSKAMPVFTNQFNIDTAAASYNAGTVTYTIPLIVNVVASNDVIIFVSANTTATITYTFAVPNLNIRVIGAAGNISFVVLQI